MLDLEVPITLEGLAEMFHVSDVMTSSDAVKALQRTMQGARDQNILDFPFQAAIGAVVAATLHQERWPSDRIIGVLLKNITLSLSANGEALAQTSSSEKPELTRMAVLMCLFCHAIRSVQVMACWLDGQYKTIGAFSRSHPSCVKLVNPSKRGFVLWSSLFLTAAPFLGQTTIIIAIAQ